MAKQETPMMRQYFDMQKQYPGAIILYRCGDFYESYGKQAVTVSKVLGISLTMRGRGSENEIEMSGFPFHALDTYLPKLVRNGHRVAICDQLEDPKVAKANGRALVKRGLTELVTPGVSYNDTVLDQKTNTYIAALHFNKQSVGISLLDISTGEFCLAQGTADYVSKLINSYAPKEILYEYGKTDLYNQIADSNISSFKLDDWVFTQESAKNRLHKQFDVNSLKGFGIENLGDGIIAAAAILYYLDQTQHLHTSHITNLGRIEGDKYVWLDKFTIRNLELFGSSYGEGKSFLDIIDKTITNMGSRTIRHWIAFPLKQLSEINKRHELVEEFFKNPDLKELILQKLDRIADIERLASKAAVARINPREVVLLKTALFAIQDIKHACLNSNSEYLRSSADKINCCSDIRDKIEAIVDNNPAIAVNRGLVIKHGVDAELDEYRDLSNNGKEYLQKLQERESEATGIPSLKISYNNVFGYYIEVRNIHKDKVPEEWIRKQTLVNAERYITQELKEYETKILSAEQKIESIETRIFNDLVCELSGYVLDLQIAAKFIAEIDILSSFAVIASNNNYNRPVMSDDNVLDIKNGRHPVIEQLMPIGQDYIANDIYLDTDTQQIIMITGPNMAGKSALLRQTALITLMAQIGSYVPADSAQIGIVDKIFTRVGASDNISMGESTFMVEMSEAASIINNLSEKSLVLFDELGRGTSTYDGISIAWSIVEHIHEQPKAKARTLFATHYHELNEMEKSFSRIKNYNVSVKELDNKIIFLRKLVKGGSEHSFGIHVAKIAGLPKSIVKRANEVLAQLENTKSSNNKKSISKKVNKLAESREGFQVSLFQLDDHVLSQVRDEILLSDINNLTPIEALNKLNDIKTILTGKS